VAAPAAVLSGVLAMIALVNDVETEGFNTLGVIVQAVPFLAVMLLTVTTLIALTQWDHTRRSSRTLACGWAISVAVPVLVAIVPVDWLIDSALKSELGPDGIVGVRFAVGVAYAINLLPTLLSFPSGVVRGGARVKSLLPASTISGWALMILSCSSWTGRSDGRAGSAWQARR